MIRKKKELFLGIGVILGWMLAVFGIWNHWHKARSYYLDWIKPSPWKKEEDIWQGWALGIRNTHPKNRVPIFVYAPHPDLVSRVCRPIERFWKQTCEAPGGSKADAFKIKVLIMRTWDCQIQPEGFEAPWPLFCRQYRRKYRQGNWWGVILNLQTRQDGLIWILGLDN